MALPASAASLPPPVQTPQFEGPLDLLLDEVRRQNMAIENIAMAPIVAASSNTSAPQPSAI
jgi:hypothetical protein